MPSYKKFKNSDDDDEDTDVIDAVAELNNNNNKCATGCEQIFEEFRPLSPASGIQQIPTGRSKIIRKRFQSVIGYASGPNSRDVIAGNAAIPTVRSSAVTASSAVPTRAWSLPSIKFVNKSVYSECEEKLKDYFDDLTTDDDR